MLRPCGMHKTPAKVQHGLQQAKQKEHQEKVNGELIYRNGQINPLGTGDYKVTIDTNGNITIESSTVNQNCK